MRASLGMTVGALSRYFTEYGIKEERCTRVPKVNRRELRASGWPEASSSSSVNALLYWSIQSTDRSKPVNSVSGQKNERS
jgi:hypothetical protein